MRAANPKPTTVERRESVEQFDPIDTGALESPATSSHQVAEAKDEASQKKVLIRTFGCQMNVYDSERMSETLQSLGYTETEDPAEADLAILNTCHIREKASEKVYSDLGRLRDVKRDRKAQGKETVIAVAGCVAQAEGQEIVRRQPAVDLVLGPQSYHRLPALMRAQKETGRAVVETEFPDEDKFQSLPQRKTKGAVTAFLTVQEGCDKFCTFCVVPYTRGMEYSRPVTQIVEEAERLVSRGVREITLLGQNVNGYHGEGATGGAASLARLIQTLAAVEGLDRIRYTTSHPRDMSDDLIELHGTEAKLMPYLHLPFQAGSDRILAAMNRKHTAAEYLGLISKIRKARPDIALSTDVIVGFPGETGAEFQATLDLVAEVGFAHAFSFKYSARPGTPAASLEDQVPEDEKSERLLRLMSAIEVGQRAFNGGLVGRVVDVLFDKPGRSEGQLSGRSPYLQMVHVDGAADLLGAIRPVEIMKAGPNSLHGRIV